jgi:hypothetical protein
MLLAAILAPVLVAAAAAQSAPDAVPVSIVVRESAEPGRLDIELTNTGTKRVVAWAFDVIGPDGRRTSRTRQDVFTQLLGDRPDDKILHPGVPTLVAWRPSNDLTGATVTARAVIYDDATAIGDPESIELIFAARRSRAAALVEIIPRLEALAAAGITEESRAAAIATFQALQNTRRESGAYQNVITNLTHFATSDVVLQHMLEELRRELALAREQSARRP